MSESPVPTALSQGPCPSFLRLASRYLGEYLEKIRRATESLDEAQIWWRPAAGINSIGNLLLHLAGNLSLWIGQGLGGEVVARDRQGEFAADRVASRDELLARLAAVIERCQQSLAAEEGRPLDRRLHLQGYDVDVLGAAFHAVEHMSYHTGQILTLAKQQLAPDERLEFYPQHRGE